MKFPKLDELNTGKYFMIFVLIGFLVFGNVLFNQFVWDDQYQPIGNSSLSISQNLHNIFFSNKTQDFHYRPLFFSYLYLLNVIFGPNPLIFHFLQLIFHFLNVFFIFLLFSLFFRRQIAFLLSLIFLVHPINIEAVSYISSTADTLFFLLGIIGLRISLADHLTRAKLITITVLLFFSLLFKENGIFFVITIPLLRLLFKPTELKKLLISATVPLGSYLILRLEIVHTFITKSVFSPIMQLSLPVRILSIPKIILYYFTTAVYPSRLAISQKWTVLAVNVQNFYVPLFLDCLVFFLIFVLGFVLYQKSKDAAIIFTFFFIWFLIGLGAHLQFIPLDMTVADRWFYFSLVGLLGMLGAAISIIKSASLLRIIYIMAIGILIIFSLRTFVRNQNWKNNASLFSHDIKYVTDSYDIESNYGVVLMTSQRNDEAEIHFKKAIALEPKSSASWYDLGIIYLKKNDIQNAKASFYKSIEYDPTRFEAYEYLATLLLKNASHQETLGFSRKSVQLFAKDAYLWKDLAIAEFNFGNHQKALEAAKQVYELSPNQDSLNLLNAISNQNK